MKQNALIWLPGIFARILGAMPSAMAGPTLTYVKTLGQSNVKGSPLRTAGSRISVDQDGNLYLCGITNGPWNTLFKLAPDGRVVWECPCSGYARTVTAVDSFALSAQNGALWNGPHKASGARAYCSNGTHVFYVQDGGIESRNIAALDTPLPFFKPPAGLKIDDTGLAAGAEAGARRSGPTGLCDGRR